MIALYSYPALFGVADNNPFGLKVFAFLKLAAVAFEQHHVFDASAAPRGQLPYIVDGGHTIGDSDTIIAHLVRSRGLAIDASLSPAQRDLAHMVSRTLDDLYWVMSYSRWHDERFWPLFCAALLDTHPELTVEALDRAKDYNAKRYHYQGIGRYEPEQAYARGLADLQVVANLLGDQAFLFGDACRRRRRCRRLRLPREHPLLRHRHAAQGLPAGPSARWPPIASACTRW